ncbi:hypothetical protein [uncultured Algoriphagus sp.]|uniref:hypothetical protein n=1 Tax=uncultured Algoriphagus sp. TaxID=417365 RepID=UPI0030EC416C
MLNLRIEATFACPATAGVFGHRSSNLISKESKVTGIIADNHISKTIKAEFPRIQPFFDIVG